MMYEFAPSESASPTSSAGPSGAISTSATPRKYNASLPVFTTVIWS